jgi:hypothetical protein
VIGKGKEVDEKNVLFAKDDKIMNSRRFAFYSKSYGVR